MRVYSKLILNKIVTFIFIMIVITCKPSADSKLRQVNALGGLKVRSGAGLQFEEVAQIPEFSRVEIIQETDIEQVINGIKGKWIKIKWNENESYAFDGFLKPLDNKFPKGQYIESAKDFQLSSAFFKEIGKVYSLGHDCLGLTYSEYNVNLKFPSPNTIESHSVSAGMEDPTCSSHTEEISKGTYIKSSNLVTAKFTELEYKIEYVGETESCKNKKSKTKTESIDVELFLVQVECDGKNGFYVSNRDGTNFYIEK